jgi:hypothetical protein
MYKSPLEIIYKDVQHTLEEEIFYAIQQVDIKVNKEELIKALAYDRKQYEKGYEDGIRMAGAVRCKDCIYWDDQPFVTAAPDFHKCKRIAYHASTADGFCDRAERKEKTDG